MYVLKNRFTIAVRAIALAVVCLFTVNTIAWSYPSDRPYSSDRTLAAQSIFKPISDEGITISARMQFEIVAGAMLLASGKTPAAANAYLTEAYRRSSDNGSRAVEFLSLHSSGGGLPAKFKVIGRNDLIFEVDFIRQDGGAVVVRRVPSPDYIGHGSDAVTGHDNPSEDSIAGILKMVSEEIARIKQTSPGRPILLLIDGPHIGKTTLAKAIMDGELADYGVSDPEAFNPEEILHISGDTFHGLHQDFAVSGPGYATYHLLDYLEAMKKDAEDGLIKPRGSYNEYLAYYIGKNLPRIMAEGKKKVVLWDEANSFGYFLTTKALFPVLDTPVTVIGVYLRRGGKGTDVSGLRARFQMWDWGAGNLPADPEKAKESGDKEDKNVTCGTICQAGHEGSYKALDEQLKRKFIEYRDALEIIEERNLSEIEADKALKKLENIQDISQLEEIRNWIRLKGAIPDSINIFFGVPEDGKKLWWVKDPNTGEMTYAGGHFNQAGTRIHISLPLILSQSDPKEAALAIARHEYKHIEAIKFGKPSPVHDGRNAGFRIVQKTSINEMAEQSSLRKEKTNLSLSKNLIIFIGIILLIIANHLIQRLILTNSSVVNIFSNSMKLLEQSKATNTLLRYFYNGPIQYMLVNRDNPASISLSTIHLVSLSRSSFLAIPTILLPIILYYYSLWRRTVVSDSVKTGRIYPFIKKCFHLGFISMIYGFVLNATDILKWRGVFDYLLIPGNASICAASPGDVFLLVGMILTLSSFLPFLFTEISLSNVKQFNNENVICSEPLARSESKELGLRVKDDNVTCGTICESGHEGSYNVLDEQLKRKFTEYRDALEITEERDLSEVEADLALQKLGNIQDVNQLEEIRRWIRLKGGIPDTIKIYFGVPEDGKKLWWVKDPNTGEMTYAGGHFNQAGTRIHISLPLILSQEDQKEAALAIAMHDYNHILGKGHQEGGGTALVKAVAFDEGQGPGGKGQAVDNGVEARAAAVKIIGGTAQKRKRVRDMLERVFQLVPAEHAVLLDTIYIKNFKEESIVKRAFLYNAGASAFGNSMTVYHTEQFDNELLMDAIAHELGHIVSRRSHGSAKVWATKLHMPLLLFFDIVAGLWLNIGILTTLSYALIIIGWMTISILIKSPVSLYMIILTPILSLFYIISESKEIRWMRNQTFVTDYASKNVREDFAETYCRYALHRNEFLKETKYDASLGARYEAMQEIFGDKDETFTNTPSKSASKRKAELREKVEHAAALSEGSIYLRHALAKSADVLYEISEGRSAWPGYDGWRQVKWHDYTHAADVALKTIEAMKNVRREYPEIPAASVLIAAIGCMYHDVGYYMNDEEFGTAGIDHEKRSMEFVRKNHAALGLKEEDAELAALVISATQFSFNPSDLDGMEAEARSKSHGKRLGAIYGARILGTLDLYDTRDEMMRDPVKVVGALREEYQRDLDRLDDFIKASEGSDVDQAKMDKARANLARLKAITMPTDEAQFTATKGFYENVADKRVEAFGVWNRFIPPVVRDAFDGFRESHFGPAKTPSQAAGIYGIDMPNEDAGYYILAQILKMRAEGIIDLYGRTAEERHSKLIHNLDRGNSAVYRDEDSGMIFIKIDGLLKNTGQAGHIGFGRSYGRTVVYIDKFIADNNPHNSARVVEGHELKEIELWKKRLGRVLGVEIKSLAGINVRRWMRENMGAAVRISRQCHKEANKGKFNIDKVITKLRKTHRVDGIEEIESLVRSRRWGRGISSRDPPLKEKEMAELFKEMWGITAASPKGKLSEGLKTARHSIYVARLASIIAGRLALHRRFDLSEIPNLQIAAELHDLGKLSVWSLTSSGELFDDATRSLVTENHIKEITKLWGAIISGLRKRGITISGRSEKAIRDAIEKHHEDRISGRQDPIGAVLNVSDRFLGRIDGGRAHKRLEDDLPSLIKSTERIWKGEIGKNDGIYDKPIKAVLHMVQEYDPMVIGIINDVAFPDEDDGLCFQTPSAAAGDDPSIVDHSSAGPTFHEEGPLKIENTRDKSICRRAWDKFIGFPHDQLEKMPISRGNSILKNRALGIFTGFSCFVAIFITYVTWTLIFGHPASANVIGSFKISYLLTPFLIHLMPIVALVEETVFRGMLYESLSKRIKAPLVANILQAVIFSSAHYLPLMAPAVVQYALLSPARPLWAILPLTIVGLVYGMLYKKGGIASSYWAHLTFNVIALSIPLGFGLFSMAVSIHTRVDLELFIAFLAYTIGFYNLFIDNLLEEDKKLSIINARHGKKAMKMGGGQYYGTIDRVALKASVEDLLQAARGMKEDGLEGQIGIIREVLRKRDPMMFHDFNIKWLNQALDGWEAERDLQGLYRMKREFNLSTVHSQLLVDEEGIGMLILGDKRIGKSRISIELLERDKKLRLGADDAVLLTVIDGDVYAAAVPLLDSHIISTRLADDPGKGHKKGIYNIEKSRLSEGFVRVGRILDLSTENIADIRIKLRESGSVSIADILRKRQWPDDSILGPVLPDDIPGAGIAVWDVILPISKEARFKNIEAISESIRGKETGGEGAISNEPDKGSAAPGEGGEKSIVHSPQSTVKEKKIASAPAESSNDPKMDGASGVRPQDGAQSALSDIFKEFKGSMYYPAAGNDFGFLLWSVYAFPGVTEYVFRDSLDQNEAGAYRPDKNDINAVAEWIEGWVRQDLGNEVEDANRDIKVEIRDDKAVNIWIKFDKMSIYEGREINISYEIGDLFENNSQYPAVYIQEPGLMGRFSEHKSFWEHIENNTADGGLVLASQWATGYAQLSNSSYIGTTEDRVMANILVYRKDKKSASAPNENGGRLTTPRQKLGVVPSDYSAGSESALSLPKGDSRGTINDEPGLPPMGGGQDYNTVRNLAMTKSVPELVEVARGMIHDGLRNQIGIICDGLRERDPKLLEDFKKFLAIREYDSQRTQFYRINVETRRALDYLVNDYPCPIVPEVMDVILDRAAKFYLKDPRGLLLEDAVAVLIENKDVIDVGQATLGSLQQPTPEISEGKFLTIFDDYFADLFNRGDVDTIKSILQKLTKLTSIEGRRGQYWGGIINVCKGCSVQCPWCYADPGRVQYFPWPWLLAIATAFKRNNAPGPEIHYFDGDPLRDYYDPLFRKNYADVVDLLPPRIITTAGFDIGSEGEKAAKRIKAEHPEIVIKLTVTIESAWAKKIGMDAYIQTMKNVVAILKPNEIFLRFSEDDEGHVPKNALDVFRAIFGRSPTNSEAQPVNKEGRAVRLSGRRFLVSSDRSVHCIFGPILNPDGTVQNIEPDGNTFRITTIQKRGSRDYQKSKLPEILTHLLLGAEEYDAAKELAAKAPIYDIVKAAKAAIRDGFMGKLDIIRETLSERDAEMLDEFDRLVAEREGKEGVGKTNVPVVADILSIEKPSPLAEDMVESGIIASGMSVLSLGSGNGNDEAFFASRHCRVLATDNNPQILEHLKAVEGKQKGLRVQAIDCEKPLNIPSESFDVVYFRLTLHYFNNTIQRQLLNEIFRVLKPGGRAIIQMKSKNDLLYNGEKVEQADGMVYFPAKKFSRNHLTIGELSDRIKMSRFNMVSIGEHLEKLYSDDYDSTLITAICIKEGDVLKDLPVEHKDEHALMVEAARSLKGYPVNMPVDISLIPRGGEAEGQLEENMATLARLMAWHHKKFGLDIHYSLTDKDAAYVEKALILLKEKLKELNNIPGINLDVDAILTPYKEQNAIEVPLMDMETLKAIRNMPENMYPVALLKDREGEGYNLPNYTAAAAIGLSMAGLRVASQKDTEIEYKSKRKEAFRTMTGIYERYGVDTKEFTEDALDILVNAKKNFSTESRRELIISLNLALPPIIKAAIDKIHECHQALQLLLQSA